jgi:hypothetical protein
MLSGIGPKERGFKPDILPVPNVVVGTHGLLKTNSDPAKIFFTGLNFVNITFNFGFFCVLDADPVLSGTF